MAIAGGLWLGYVVLAPTRYTASMSILVDPRERMPLGLDAPPAPQNPDVALVESQMRILVSNSVLRRVVESQHLASDPSSAPGMVGQMIAAVTGLIGAKPLTPDSQSQALTEALAREITMKRGERSYVIDIDVKGRTPDKAVALARALVDAYFANQAAMSADVATRQTEWLEGRLADLRGRVETAERRAQDYRDEQSLVSSDGRLSPEQQLKDANDALVAARGKRGEIEARRDQLSAAFRQGGKSESINDAIRSPVIEKLRADQSALARDEAYERSVLGPRHPTYLTTKMQLAAVQNQIAAELQRIRVASERELNSARAAEQDAARLVASLETATNRSGDSRVQLTQLESHASALRSSYEKMLGARESIKRDVIESPNATIVDPPIAGLSRTSPKTLLSAFIALAGGLNLWIVAALIAEYRARRRGALAPSPGMTEARKSRLADAAATKAPVFAIDVPTFGAARSFGSFADRRAQRTTVAIVRRAMRLDTHFKEAIERSLQGIRERCPTDQTAPVVAIAGQAPGAGVSTVVLALAFAACARGTRVLIVDADFEHPGLSEETRELRRTPLGEPGQIARVLHQDAESNGEILLSPFDRHDKSLPDARLRARFDLILVDCGGSEGAAGAAAGADALIMITREGQNRIGAGQSLGDSGNAQGVTGRVRVLARENFRKRA